MGHGLNRQGWVGYFHRASHGEEDEEGGHQTEEHHSLRQGKAQNGMGEELLLQRRVPGIANDQAVSIPAPEPATPTVAAPAPINSAALSMSQEITLVWNSAGPPAVGHCYRKAVQMGSLAYSGRRQTQA